MTNFDHLFNQSGLYLYDRYQAADEQLFSFLTHYLPTQYAIKRGFLANRRKEISEIATFLVDSTTCPDLPLDEEKAILPANYAYGICQEVDEVNQTTLAQMLEKSQALRQVYNHQKRETDNELTLLDVWFARDLAAFISLNDLEDRLLAEAQAPELVVILNRGVLVALTPHTIRKIFALSQKNRAQSFDKKILEDLQRITEVTTQKQYFKIVASAPFKNFFNFYILLLELLKNQPLLDDDPSAELMAIW
ncbi:MAG: hypothetical protein AAF960_07960 [Bacteroidota bacterium]